jgi:hypothetical protein
LDPTLGERVLEDGRRLAREGSDLRLACGVLIQLLLDPASRSNWDLQSGVLRVVEEAEKAGKDLDPVLAWLGAVASYAVGRVPWERMKTALERNVVETQRRDGHACCFRGSWEPGTRQCLPGGRVTATAACALALQVFYTYDGVFGAR